ncbi:gamma-glutamylcyclotransferase-like [Physella acuta]|uniref:gamma-glutamylcyclotransferase-like n=1 Tax=Physella acuta TaxID=109671 RepID=UPI0027DB55FB|nr:gamma-glutamylcyclotransferase-like [Physella acuta]
MVAVKTLRSWAYSLSRSRSRKSDSWNSGHNISLFISSHWRSLFGIKEKMADTKFQYFSYGSNLLRERILVNNPSATFHGIGKLKGFILTFDTPKDVGDDLWLGATATIRPGSVDDFVWGVVWDMDLEHLKTLDEQEMGYRAYEVTVDVDGQPVPCRTYEMCLEPNGNKLPSPYYLKVIIDGAKQNGLPADYITFLESFPHNGNNTPPPRYIKVMEMIEKFRGHHINGTIPKEL